jgi:hypothetical protein
MDIIAKIRRRHFISHESISAIARDIKLSRSIVHKHNDCVSGLSASQPAAA